MRCSYGCSFCRVVQISIRRIDQRNITRESEWDGAVGNITADTVAGFVQLSNRQAYLLEATIHPTCCTLIDKLCLITVDRIIRIAPSRPYGRDRISLAAMREIQAYTSPIFMSRRLRNDYRKQAERDHLFDRSNWCFLAYDSYTKYANKYAYMSSQRQLDTPRPVRIRRLVPLVICTAAAGRHAFPSRALVFGQIAADNVSSKSHE